MDDTSEHKPTQINRVIFEGTNEPRWGSDMDSGCTVTSYRIEGEGHDSLDPLLRASYEHERGRLRLRLVTDLTLETFWSRTNVLTDSLIEKGVEDKRYSEVPISIGNDITISSPFGLFYFIPRRERSPLVVVETHITSPELLGAYISVIASTIPIEQTEAVLSKVEEAAAGTQAA
jgi:hypothetical protein